MEQKITATEARTHFGEVMQTVMRTKQPIIVEKSGKPQMVLLSIEQYEQFKERKSKHWLEQLEQTHTLIEQGSKPLPDINETIQTMREERDAHLLDLSRR